MTSPDYRAPLARLRETRYRAMHAIVVETGIGLQTLRALKYGLTTNPRLETIEKLRDFFLAHPDTERVPTNVPVAARSVSIPRTDDPTSDPRFMAAVEAAVLKIVGKEQSADRATFG